MKARQGKCPKCEIVFSWEGSLNVGDARCPQCGAYLRRTSQNVKLPIVEASVVKSLCASHSAIVKALKAVYLQKALADG